MIPLIPHHHNIIVFWKYQEECFQQSFTVRHSGHLCLPHPWAGCKCHTTAAASQLRLCFSDAAIYNQPQNETSLTAKAHDSSKPGELTRGVHCQFCHSLSQGEQCLENTAAGKAGSNNVLAESGKNHWRSLNLNPEAETDLQGVIYPLG